MQHIHVLMGRFRSINIWKLEVHSIISISFNSLTAIQAVYLMLLAANTWSLRVTTEDSKFVKAADNLVAAVDIVLQLSITTREQVHVQSAIWNQWIKSKRIAMLTAVLACIRSWILIATTSYIKFNFYNNYCIFSLVTY